jgi:hypothetical protein
VGGQDRLRSLQVSVSGDDQIPRLDGRPHEASLKFEQAGIKFVERLTRPKTQVQRDLVISASSGVKLSTDVPQTSDERALDVKMDVFLADVELEAILGDFGFDFTKRAMSWR